MNSYAYDAEGMLTSSNGEQYVYDGYEHRVEKTGGGNSTEYIYFNGKPLALYNPANGAWTDLIWAGSNLLAEVPGSQGAVPVYRLLDHEGSLVATTDNSGNVTGTNLLTPYGQLLTSSTNDPYLYTGLYQDTEYGGYDAWYRNYSAEQSRWLSPDPYNGSYDLMNPQSFNRYMYTNGNPLGYVDPSGLADGWANGLSGGPCSDANGTVGSFQFNSISVDLPGFATFNPCAPLASGLSVGIYYGLIAAGVIDASSQIFKEIVPWVGFGISVACDFDSGSNACGQKDWTSVFIGGDVGKAVSTGISLAGAIFATACAASGGWACPAALGYAIYTGFNDLFGVLWDVFGGTPQFTGSLLPRPSDLGGLGTSPIGIPNQNLSSQGIMAQPSHNAVQSPGMKLP